MHSKIWYTFIWGNFKVFTMVVTLTIYSTFLVKLLWIVWEKCCINFLDSSQISCLLQCFVNSLEFENLVTNSLLSIYEHIPK